MKKEWRKRALEAVRAAVRAGSMDEEENAVRDMLCHLLHWCDVHEIDFQDELRIARMHFDAEKGGIE